MVSEPIVNGDDKHGHKDVLPQSCTGRKRVSSHADRCALKKVQKLDAQVCSFYAPDLERWKLRELG
jgi:hypothetical protein